MQYSAYHHPRSPASSAGGPATAEHHYTSPTTIQARANLRSCLRQGNFSSNRSTRSTPSAVSYPQQQPQQQLQSRGDEDDRTARSAPTTTGSLISNDNDERHFMKLSNMLATQHKSGNYSSPQGTRQLLHYYIPSARQRQFFYQTLRRNSAFLPMFPEPNENPGFALTRYVERVFGPLLERECAVSGGGGSVASATNGVGPPSPMSTSMRSRELTSPNSYTGQIQQPSLQQQFGSAVNYAPPPSPLGFTSVDSRHNRPTLFPSPDNNVDPSNLSSPISPPIPQPLEYITNNQGTVLFPPPQAARVEVTNALDRIPPPVPSSPMVLPTANSDTDHIPPQQSPTHRVSFPMYSQPISINNIRESPRQQLPLPLPRPYPTTSTTVQQPSLFASPSKSLPFTIGEELNKSSHIQQHPLMHQQSLLNNTSTDTTSVEGSTVAHHQEEQAINNQIQEALSKSASMGATPAAANAGANPTGMINTDDSRHSKVTPMGYQKFQNNNMLPQITPRENILYDLPSRQKQLQVEPSCCAPSEPTRAKRKRPTYLQLYVKCERSEPYLQPSESMDIVTYYRNGNNQVTADRTLVVRGTTSLLDLIGGIIEAFGLHSEYSDACMKASASTPVLMAHNDICFMSDVKVTTTEEQNVDNDDTAKTSKLTPLPIPGFYYKYVDREVHGRSEMEKESLLSTDPVVLTRTLVAQVLDKPLYQSQTNKQKQGSDGDGIRTRLALVYCAPKRQAYLSPRTQKGVLPETIYHFQILLDGIVPEEDLPSSFTSQTAIRCVGSTGGVAGGSMIDSVDEIQDLNRTLWGVNDVVGLVHSTPDPQRNLEQIIDVLGVPLFDNVGNQTLKEMAIDRVLYHIYSGNLSLSMAKKTQRTVEKMQGTSEWLAKGVEAFTKGIGKGITSCVEDDILFGGDDLDGDMSRLSVNSDAQPKQKQQLMSSRSGLLAKAESRRRKNSKRFNNRNI